MVSFYPLVALALSVQGLAIKPVDSAHQPAKRSEAKVLQLDFDVERTYPSLQLARRDYSGAKLNNSRDVRYFMDMYIGSNKQKIRVDIDTGSSDLWVHDEFYGLSYEGMFNQSESETFNYINESFKISYNDGTVTSGVYGKDTVSLEDVSTLDDFQFAVASNSTNKWTPAIFGISRKVQEAAKQEYDNFPYALVAAGIIPKPSYSIYMSKENGNKGLVLFGGIDQKKYEGDLVSYPISDSWYASIELKTLSYEGKDYTLNRSALLDTGTSWNFLPKDIVMDISKLLGADTCESCDRNVPCDQPNDKFMTFDFGGQQIKLSYADLVVRPQPGMCLLGLDVAGANDNLILGDVFLRHAYTYYDFEENTIAIAPAVDTEESDIVQA